LATVGDFLSGFEAGALFGIAAPKNTANEVVDRRWILDHPVKPGDDSLGIS
jgi:hypothetical protein